MVFRWAAKEAAYKALYSSFIPTWKELSYYGLQSNGQKPRLIYQPFNGLDTIKIRLHSSISHDGDYIFASVIVEDDYST